MADNFRFAQLGAFSLAGSGAVIGATSITLKSMLDIDGGILTMSGTFGSTGYATLQPGEGDLEEQISFTGLTNNANGTTTLSGVSTVSFVYPYTETSGLAKTHAGSTTLVISNTSGFYNKLTSKSDDETITGTWTFTNPNYPRMDTATPPPTDDEQLATKKYVDDTAVSGAPDATLTVKGIVEVATAAEINSGATTGGTGASVVVRPDQFLLSNIGLAAAGDNTDIAVGSGNKFVTQTGLQKSVEKYAASATGNDTYVITLSPVPTSYVNGMTLRFKADVGNTGAATLNVNSLGAISITKNNDQALITGDIEANQIVEVTYNSTGPTFQMQSQSALVAAAVIDVQTFTTTNTWTKPGGTPLKVLVQIWGGGGGGANRSTSGSGGGGGEYTEYMFDASQCGATETVTIGTGGAAQSDGVATSFGTLLVAAAGKGSGVGGSGNLAGGNGGSQLGVNVTGLWGIGASAAAGTNGRYSGAGAGVNSNVEQAAGNSYFGGAGGGAVGPNPGNITPGGTSIRGGSGGTGSTSGVGGVGTIPSGGGGAGSGGGGAGARGHAIVTTFF